MTVTWSVPGAYLGPSLDPARFPGHILDNVVHQTITVETLWRGAPDYARPTPNEIPEPSTLAMVALACAVIRRTR